MRHAFLWTRMLLCIQVPILAGFLFGGFSSPPELTTRNLYLRSIGPVLHLNTAPPDSASPAFKDSPAVDRSTYREIGTWLDNPLLAPIELDSSGQLHVWLGLVSTEDKGTLFDLRAELRKNLEVISAGTAANIRDLALDPGKAREVVVAFGGISERRIARGEALSLRILARVSQKGERAKARGVRVYFDSVNRASRFNPSFAPANSEPVADAGKDRNAPASEPVKLDGSGSYDPDGDLVTFQWSQVQSPAGSSASLADASRPSPHFTPDLPGDYIFELTVSDGSAASPPERVRLRVFSGDVPPNARAGREVHAAVGRAVSLDGSGSDDHEGQPLNFLWSFASVPSGSALTNSGIVAATTAAPQFVPDMAGTYVLRLQVDDGALSDDDRVEVEAEQPNAAPNADAGGDQEIDGLMPVTLDGRRSFDPDEQPMPLSYSWAFASIPAASRLTNSDIADSGTPTPSFTPDAEGAYILRLEIGDGDEGDADNVLVEVKPEASITVPDVTGVTQEEAENAIRHAHLAVGTITSANSGTVPSGAVISQDPAAGTTAAAGSAVHLVISLGPAEVAVPDVTGMTDAAARAAITAAGLTVGSITSVNSAAVAAGHVISQTPPAGSTVAPGSAVGLVISLGPALVSVPAVTGLDQQAATAAVLAAGLTVGNIATANSATVPAGNVVSQAPAPGTLVPPASAVDLVTSLGPATVTVPDVVGMTQSSAEAAIAGAGLVAGSVTSASSDTVPAGSVISQNPAAGASALQGSHVDLVVSLGSDISGLPPDPSSVAPPVERGVATTVGSATSFLYTGANPIQTGVSPGTIHPLRAAVLRGRVLDRNGAALSAVGISILDHPEFGGTLSRADGVFDMAVNGGGFLTIRYVKAGYISAQRQVQVPWQDFCAVPNVVMLPFDTQATTVELSAAAAAQVARGSLVSDADGQRRATIMFPQGTTAQMVMPDGSTQPLAGATVRAAEFTAGANGREAMPAELPETSGYTYAVELSADEAQAAGAVDVRFSAPLPVYVENFAGFPVGALVPAGYYDRVRGKWIAAPNGRVLEILDVSGGLANVDINGDGAADTGAALADLGITDAERQALAGLYTAPVELWRVPVSHFTPWDFNWPYGPCADCEPPDPRYVGPDPDRKPDDPCEKTGSIIECQSQVLGEEIRLSGSRMRLHYRSDRVPGFIDNRGLRIRLTGATVHPSLARIHLEILVAGRKFTQDFAPAPNLEYVFTWDGLDAYGRAVLGTQPATVRIGYEYPAQYYATRAEFTDSFSRFNTFGGTPASGSGSGGSGGAGLRVVDFDLIRVRTATPPIILWTNFPAGLGRSDVAGQVVAGWSLTPHHFYDPAGKTLFFGNGRRRSAKTEPAVIRTIAGNGTLSFAGDGNGSPALDVAMPNTGRGLAYGPDGSLYVSFTSPPLVRRIRPDGTIITVAGGGSPPDGLGDGGPATRAALNGPHGLTVGPDNSLYIADRNNNLVRRVGPDGIISSVAGNRNVFALNDGQPATQAYVGAPEDVALGADGSLYIASLGRIRRVGPDGIISTIAGTGENCSPATAACGDGDLATAAAIGPVPGLATGPDGSVYFADGLSRVRKVGPDGIVRRVAGQDNCFSFGGPFGTPDLCGEGGRALLAKLGSPSRIAVARDGSVYIVETSAGHRVRWVGPDGIITTVAGTGYACNPGNGAICGDAGPAALANLLTPYAVALSKDGALAIGDQGSLRIRQVAPALPGISLEDFAIASDDGREVYVFDRTGRHLRTVDTFTGTVRFQFTYDATGRLASIADVDGGVTAIERDADGNPAAIVTPFGVRTALTVNAGGYLASVTNPLGQTVQMEYAPQGLLTGFTDARNHRHSYAYGPQGRLTSASGAGTFGDGTSLERTDSAGGYNVTVRSALNRNTHYRVETLAGGDTRRVATGPGGEVTEEIRGRNGVIAQTDADGTRGSLTPGPDPRFGLQAPAPAEVRWTTPANRTFVRTVTRAATLSNPGDPLSLVTQTETESINGRNYENTYSAAARTSTQSSPEGRQYVLSLTPRGRIASAQLGNLEATTIGYDARGFIAAVTQGSGAAMRSLSLTFNAQGLLGSFTRPEGMTDSFTYDGAGRLASHIRPDGEAELLSYDAAGNFAGITPPGRGLHRFDHNAINRIASYTPPDLAGLSTPTTYVYDTDRQLVRINQPGPRSVQIGYDGAGRPNSYTIGRGQITAAYNAASGTLAALNAPGVSLGYAFDGLLLTSESISGALNATVGRDYDNDFRLISLSVNGSAVPFSYDRDGYLIRAGSELMAREPQTGLITGTTLGNVADSRSYNGFAEPAAYSASFSSTPLYSVSYTRDLLGRIMEKTESVLGGLPESYAYHYDILSRLTEVRRNGAITHTYAYDLNGNRTAATGPGGTAAGTYDAQDRLLTYGPAGNETACSYSLYGELLSKTMGGQTTTYTYDELGNLLEVQPPGGAAARIEYLVDGRNRRVEKRRGGVVVQRFLYQDGRRVVAELDGSNTVVSRFVYGTNSITPDFMIRAGSTFRFVIDQVGSVRLVVDVSTGAVQQRLEYDVFGNVTNDTSPGFQPFGFAGGLYDPDTRLVRFGARDYDAETGRWTAKDPSLFGGRDTNLYRYAFGDPVNYLDPTGRFAILAAPIAAEVFLGVTVAGVVTTLAVDYYLHHHKDTIIPPPLPEHERPTWPAPEPPVPDPDAPTMPPPVPGPVDPERDTEPWPHRGPAPENPPIPRPPRVPKFCREIPV